MNFLTLHDPLISVLFEDDEIVAVNKPYGIDTHTNDSKVAHADLVAPGLIELFEKQMKTKLHIVHRLDRTTTGAIVFAKTPEGAKKYRDLFRAREAKKTYLFVTDQQSSQPEMTSETPIVHKGSQLEAKTEFTRLRRSAKFELWQARPHTGRNHQIRIHAKELGLALLGDAKYGGQPFPFLCLHNRKLEFSNGVSIEAEAPRYFDDLALLEDVALAKVLFEVDRRHRFFGTKAETDQCFRLMSARRGSGAERESTLEQFGEYLCLSWYRDEWRADDRERYRLLATLLEKPILVRYKQQRFLLTEHGEAELGDRADKWLVREGEIKYELDLASAQAPGLYLDLRLQRGWLRDHSLGKSVLNLFAHTCGASVAAALGGAAEVSSVDTNKSALDRGRRNFEVNGLKPNEAKFFCREGLAYLEQCRTKGTTFDLIVCSPPSFWRGDKLSFKIETSLEALLKGCLTCLAAGGELLFSTTSEALFVDDIRKAVLKVQEQLGQDFELESIQPSVDFELPGERQTVKSILIRRRHLNDGNPRGFRVQPSQ